MKEAIVEKMLAQVITATSRFLTAVRTTIARGGGYAGNADTVLEAAFGQYDAVIRSLDDLLRARVDGLHRRELLIFGFVFAMLALAAILMAVSTRSIARPRCSIEAANFRVGTPRTYAGFIRQSRTQHSTLRTR